jgi:hypothetical protein
VYTHTNTTTRTPRECDNAVDGVFFIAVPSIPAIAVCNKMYNKKKKKKKKKIFCQSRLRDRSRIKQLMKELHSRNLLQYVIKSRRELRHLSIRLL